jgi:hypothetical protein
MRGSTAASQSSTFVEPWPVERDLFDGAERWRSQMTALARTIARAFPANSPQVNTLQQLLLFALAGLFVSVLVATYGIDLSPGFF